MMASGPGVPIVDSHVHLWDPARFRMPWLDGDPVLAKAFGLSEFTAATEEYEVAAFVYLEVDLNPSYRLLEARWAAQQPQIAAIVASAPIEDGRVVRTYLSELVGIDPRIRGVRRLLQSETVDFGVQPGFIDALRVLPGYDLSFDICIKHHQLRSTIEMVRACPETSFIVDHVAKPDIRAGLLDPWRADMAELAALPNVLGCKISGMVTEADWSSWTAEDLAPYVRHVLAEFGEDRVLFGGDWPVVTHAATYGRWVETLTSLTVALSDNAKRKLWNANAKRIYRLLKFGRQAGFRPVSQSAELLLEIGLGMRQALPRSSTGVFGRIPRPRPG